jgi:hypothetical protein
MVAGHPEVIGGHSPAMAGHPKIIGGRPEIAGDCSNLTGERPERVAGDPEFVFRGGKIGTDGGAGTPRAAAPGLIRDFACQFRPKVEPVRRPVAAARKFQVSSNSFPARVS